jgi:hypothetical protein
MPRSLLVVLLVGTAFGLAGGPADAALGSPWWQAAGGAAGDSLGWAVAGLTDVDGDGLGDVVVGAPDDDVGLLNNAGSVQVRSGVDGQVLWTALGDGAGDSLGRAVAGTPDLDGDGVADVIVGAPMDDAPLKTDAGSARVYSGASGTLLWTAIGNSGADRFGSAVAGVADLDGDGAGDVIVGAFLDSPAGVLNAGSVFVYSGASGALLWQAGGTGTAGHFATAVAGAGDLDGDGYGDVLVGAPDEDISGLSNVGRVYAYSGASGTSLWTKAGTTGLNRFGSSVAGVPSLLGAGVPGVAVGAYLDDPIGRPNAGRVYALAGTTGAVIWSAAGNATNDFFGWAVGGGADVDDDGYGDVVAGAPFATVSGQSSVGAAYVLSGQTGASLFQYSGSSLSEAVGRSVDFLADVDGDGRGDVVVGSSGFDAPGMTDAGQVSVFATQEAELDITPPDIACVDDMVVEASGPDGEVVTFSVTATDDMDPAPTITCDPASGSTFPLGTTTVTCTAVDASGNDSTCSFTVTVVDTTLPQVSCAVTMSSIWPPDHRMQDVGFSVTASDGVDANLELTVQVYSDEEASAGEVDATFDGSVLKLRADRNGTGDGRVYVIVVVATDDAGNSTTACCTVVVPKSEAKAQANSAKAQATGAAIATMDACGGAPMDYVTVLSATAIP